MESPFSSKAFMAYLRIPLFLFCLELLLSMVIIAGIEYGVIKNRLSVKVAQIKKDAVFTNNSKWNLSLYNSDPTLLASFPLYFISTEGFVIDRRSPIHGFLDTADFKLLLNYTKPQTINTITNQERRIYSEPIRDNGKTIGVIAVSYTNPPMQILDEIDTKLRETKEKIFSKITVKNSIIEVSKIDERKLPTDVAFLVVDKYNAILKKSTNVTNLRRISSFIDPSYVKREFSAAKDRIMRDKATGEWYALKTEVLKKNNTPIGILIIGENLSPIFSLVLEYIKLQSVLGISLLVVATFLIYGSQLKRNTKLVTMPSNISFSGKTGILNLAETEIKIPYATNQYYLLTTLIKKPARRFETDELLDIFGDNDQGKNWRQVYDAMVKINRKVYAKLGKKLIVVQNKTYQINPVLTHLIRSN
ncbi:MAG: hypothetical protein ACM3IJ_03105 [Candidatus Levyibacteriota bacterium]